MSTVAFTSGQDELSYIQQESARLGLDPRVPLAVAPHEGGGLPAAVGDYGTSFGPWQLHAGGALPAEIWNQGAAFSQQWANSPAGLDYALEGIKRAVGAATGTAAVTRVVTDFERPLHPEPEILTSIETYLTGSGPHLDAAVGSGLSTTGTQQASGTAGAAGAQTGAASPVGLFDGLNPGVSLGEAFGKWLEGKLGVSGAVSGVESSLEKAGLRVVELVLGVGLVGLGLVGIYVALAKGESKVSVLLQPLPVVGGQARRDRSDRRAGESQRRSAETKRAARQGTPDRSDDELARARVERQTRRASRPAADTGSIPF